MNIEILKQMIKEPASKKWFSKYGSHKSKALDKASGKTRLPKSRMLTKAEQLEKTKHWPSGHSEKVNTVDYQQKMGRAYSE